jgi:hypothetical protein
MAPLKRKHILQAEREELLLSLCPVSYIEVDYKTDLLQEINETDIDQVVMKLAALDFFYSAIHSK